ncbi:hypothetical protein [Sphingobacterium bovistauri]|uniref:Uncharacterized protein n=1 Tax=Sphingobacterium bovistauri TaxID=2781959 RepID=A0ABS7Z177_9SPHI|nr:hypothetical protein [Sphingobacterium bovistauri]MCA5003922.1 hypothetical protein [Sphingobacterium bovistauri]
MEQNQYSESILIYAPFSFAGIFTPNNLLKKGFSVQLLTHRGEVNAGFLPYFNGADTQLRVFEIDECCTDDIFKSEDLFNVQKILLLKGIQSKDWIFNTSFDEGSLLRIIACENKFLQYAEVNAIPVINSTAFYCSSVNFEEIIIHILSFFKEDTRRLMVNSLDLIIHLPDYFNADKLFIGDQHHIVIDQNSMTSVRELIRCTFEPMGLEIQFSGKGVHERGVIVDFDDDTLAQFGLHSSKIRLGNTVVKMNDFANSSIETYLNLQAKDHDDSVSKDYIVDYIKNKILNKSVI